jgi:membrane-anchored glycerophosphoryl diester phosphodiesterase (GDPDase)
MDNQLRPLNLGEILDRTAQLYRRNFWLFVGTAALPLLIVFALAIPAGAVLIIPGVSSSRAGGLSPAEIGIIALIVIIALPVYLAVYVYSYAGITQATVSVHLGEKPTIRATLKSVHTRFWTYLWYLLLQGIVAALVPMIIAMSVIGPLIYLMTRSDVDLGSRVALGFVMFLVAIVAFVAIVWLTLCFALGMPACIVEKKTAWESLLRSWHLSRGTRGRVFVTYLLVGALAFAIGMALAVPLLILVAVLPAAGITIANSSTVLVVTQIVRFGLDFISKVLLAPIYMIAAVLFYYDQRIRKEGFDIEWMMQRAGLAPPQPESGSAGIPGFAQPTSAGSPGAPAGLPPDSAGVFGPVTPPDSVERR